MSRKNNKGKPTRKDIEQALGIIGQKLEYLENYTIANERVFDLFLEFKGIKKEFIDYMDKSIEKQKELEKTPEDK
tara:strand:- start:445 stop:669 length:225 start_codon:yes stop_codon:yes gene_type:complete